MKLARDITNTIERNRGCIWGVNYLKKRRTGIYEHMLMFPPGYQNSGQYN
jgi:hypothetical protein